MTRAGERAEPAREADVRLTLSAAAHDRFAGIAAAEGLTVPAYLERLARTLPAPGARNGESGGGSDGPPPEGRCAPERHPDQRLVLLGITDPRGGEPLR
ncbi:hypothetical protein [Streptomyces marokkonensis]|uniref:hypothetical protein n=1 Tax=Streptomyces marokkonensis TaxID=324855 RepID=UPI0011F2FE0F|nr:hypothetical protein [Streptomyces marokkonensis]